MCAIKRLWIASSLAISFACLSHTSMAEEWPDRPITMIIMSKEGGGMDNASRHVGNAMAERLGQPIKYVNRPGASGRTALNLFLKNEADGYTVFSGNLPTLMMMHGQQQPGYAMEEKLTWLGAYLVDPAMLVVPINSPHESLVDFITEARETPIRMGVANWASVQTLALLQLQDATGAKIEIIPYSGFAKAVVALAGNHIEGGVGNFSAVQKHGEKMRALGIFADQMPDGSALNSISEALDADVIDAASIRALGVHTSLANTHPDRFKLLETVFMETIQDPAFAPSFEAIGADPGQSVEWGTKEAEKAATGILDLFEAHKGSFEKKQE